MVTKAARQSPIDRYVTYKIVPRFIDAQTLNDLGLYVPKGWDDLCSSPFFEMKDLWIGPPPEWRWRKDFCKTVSKALSDMCRHIAARQRKEEKRKASGMLGQGLDLTPFAQYDIAAVVR